MGSNSEIPIVDLNRFTKYVSNRTDFVVEDHHACELFEFAFKSMFNHSKYLSDFIQGNTTNAEAPNTPPPTGDVYNAVGQQIIDASMAVRRNMIIGEFSTALPDSVLAAGPSADSIRQQFGTAQINLFSNATAGWGFFSRLFAEKFQCTGIDQT